MKTALVILGGLIAMGLSAQTALNLSSDDQASMQAYRRSTFRDRFVMQDDNTKGASRFTLDRQCTACAVGDLLRVGSGPVYEIVQVTAVPTNTRLDISRGVNGTTALAWTAGVEVLLLRWNTNKDVFDEWVANGLAQVQESYPSAAAQAQKAISDAAIAEARRLQKAARDAAKAGQ